MDLNNVNQVQFGEHLPGEGVFTPTYSSAHLAPGRSAYGSAHPIDVALGKAYRRRSLSHAAKGESMSGHSAALHAASDTLRAAGAYAHRDTRQVIGGTD